MFKELQLTLGPAENPDGSRKEPSGRGYFPGAYNGADVTAKDSKRFADTEGWGYFNFNHSESCNSQGTAEREMRPLSYCQRKTQLVPPSLIEKWLNEFGSRTWSASEKMQDF